MDTYNACFPHPAYHLPPESVLKIKRKQKPSYRQSVHENVLVGEISEWSERDKLTGALKQ